MIGLGAAIYSISFPISQLAAAGIHIYTIYLAYHSNGIGAAILTFFMPFVSQIYWFIKFGSQYGYDNMFAVCLYIFAGLLVLNGIGVGLMAQGEKSGAR